MTADAAVSTSATLAVPSGDAGRGLRLLLSAVGPKNITTSESSTDAAKLVYQDGTTVESLVSISRCLASHSEQKQRWLGSTAESQAQIEEWLTWSGTEFTPLVDDQLKKVNDWLLTRTFLVGNDCTLADLVVAATTYPALCSFPAAQTTHFASLLRWAEHVLYLHDSSQAFPPLAFQKPAFKPPPPPAPAAPSTSPSAAANAQGGTAQTLPGGKVAAAAAPAAGGGKAAAGGNKAPAAAAAPAAAEGAKGEGGKKDKKEKEKKEKPAPAKKEEEEPRIDMLDIRVGQIVAVDRHPNADALYLEEIDVGEGKPRQVISGLVKWVPIEEMRDRRVVVVTNLKPAKLKDVMSYGMVFCATSEAGDKTEPILPPAGAAIGERIKFEGYDADPLEEVNPKKKILERLFPDLKTDADGVAVYKGAAFMTSAGAVISSVVNGIVK